MPLHNIITTSSNAELFRRRELVNRTNMSTVFYQ